MISQYNSLAIVAIALIARVSDALPPKKIVGGQRAEPGEFPYQVSLRMGNSMYCGGTIITNRHVLTAAHCVHNFTIPNIGLWTGSLKETAGHKHAVKSVHTHFQFSYDHKINDIAIIVLNGTIELNNTQNILALPDEPTLSYVTANITGWGYTTADLKNPSIYLKKLTVRTLTAEKCQQYYDGSEILDSTQICTYATPGNSFCNGDSGGPLVRNGRLIGIISFNIPCATQSPDVYTNVYHYVNWIRQLVSST